MIEYQKADISKIKKTDIICLDIETTSYWVDKCGHIIGYDSNISDDDYNNMDAGALCYIWMLGINDTVYYGRELSDLYTFLNMINDLIEEENHIIWVHNLAYEFGFLINYLSFDNVFSRTERHPMKATYKKIEFRCTYMLTRLSLEKWSEQTSVKKLIGNLDYTILRTPKTKLNYNELAYCEHDILVMYEGLQTYIKRYGNQNRIPLTQTGEVRKKIKDRVKRDNRYHRLCTRLVPKNVNEYKTLKKCFGGGDVHANIKYIGEVVKNVGSFDESSAYPSMIFRKKFPMYPWEIVTTTNFDFDKYAYIFTLRMYNVECKGLHHYIAKSRMVAINNGIYENGRVIKADFISCVITEIDLQIIQDFYNIERIEYVTIRKSRKAPISYSVIDEMLTYFRNKTMLKGQDDDIYLWSKQLLNSFFGMMVTDPCNLDVSFLSDSNTWNTEPLTNEKIQETLNNLQNNPYKNILSYSWGIYVTAYNRQELWHMIRLIDEGKTREASDIIYYDTDSLKIKNAIKYKHIFEAENKRIIAESEEACKRYGIPLDSFKAQKKNGDYAILGIWENEGNKNTFIEYNEFITLGAKKYAYKIGDEIGITVAGVPKKAKVCLSSLEQFKNGFIFDRDICGKNQLRYIDDNPLITFPDGYIVKERYGINIKNCGYTLGLTTDFIYIINQLREKGWFF